MYNAELAIPLVNYSVLSNSMHYNISVNNQRYEAINSIDH